MNAVLDTFTVLAVYRFACHVLGDADRPAAAAAAFVWAVSAAALQVCVVEARQYSLLALIAVLFTDQLARLVHDFRPAAGQRRFWRALGVTLLTGAGALTHHHFAILVAGALGLCVIGRIAADRRRVVYAVGSAAAGYALLVAVHPFFFGTGFKHLSDSRLPDAAGFAARGRQALEALAHLVLERRHGSGLPLLPLALLACIVPAIFLAAWLKVRRWRPDAFSPARDEASAAEPAPPPPSAPLARFALGVGVWVSAVTLGLYLSGITPAHAMSYRYLATAWPFVAIAVGIALARGPRRANRPARLTPVLITCILALLVGVLAAWLQWHNLSWHPGAAEADRLVRTARRAVIDNVGRGHWPRAAWRLPEDARVLIATPNDLLRRPAAWRRELEPGTVYISPSKSAVGPREKILQSLRKDYQVRGVGHLAAVGEVYVVGQP